MRFPARFSFATLRTGEANRRAVTAARAVAQSPGRLHNPLIVYGGPGVGKTHVLGAIVEHVRHAHPDLVVEALTVPEFSAQVGAAVASGGLDAWYARWPRVGLFVLDDLEQISHHPEAQPALRRLSITMLTGIRQLVLAGAVAPSEIAGLEPSLLSQWRGGYLAELGPPDAAMRSAILHASVAAHGLDVPGTIVDALARREEPSVRALEAALVRAAELYAEASTDDVESIVVRSLGPTPRVAPEPRAGFQTFLSSVSTVLAQHVPNLVEPGPAPASTGAPAPAPARGPEPPPRVSVAVPPSESWSHDDGKLIWDWPDPVARIIEELH